MWEQFGLFTFLILLCSECSSPFLYTPFETRRWTVEEPSKRKDWSAKRPKPQGSSPKKLIRIGCKETQRASLSLREANLRSLKLFKNCTCILPVILLSWCKGFLSVHCQVVRWSKEQPWATRFGSWATQNYVKKMDDLTPVHLKSSKKIPNCLSLPTSASSQISSNKRHLSRCSTGVELDFRRLNTCAPSGASGNGASSALITGNSKSRWFIGMLEVALL